MRFFILFIATFLFADISITAVNLSKKEVYLNSSIKNGKSGYVICNYLNTPLICARVVFFGKRAKLYNYDELINKAFATPIVLPKVGDKLVENPLKRIVILAPNQESYLQIKSKFKDKVIVSSDVLATYLYKDFSKKRLKEFAKEMNIDAFLVVYNHKIYLLDSFSLHVLDSFDTKFNNTSSFFTYYKNYDIKIDYKTLLKD